MKKVDNKDLVIGRRYWICEKGSKVSYFRRPLLFIGYKSKQRSPWFTFGDNVEDWQRNFNFIAKSSKYNFYEV